MEWIMGLQRMWSAGFSNGYMVAFRDTIPNEETELICAVLTFTASRPKGGGGQLSVIPNSCSPQQRSQWLSPWCEHCIETHAAGWTYNYQTWSCLLRWERGQGDCVSFYFFVSRHNGVSGGLWNHGEEEGSERRRTRERGRGQRERETWGDRDKGERDNQTHTYMNTRVHTCRHTIVTEHHSEVTTVLFFQLLCQ